jgi:hypothetical protein
MVTNYLQEIVTQPVTAAENAPDKAISRLWKRVQAVLCSVRGHDPLLHFDQNRIYLRCASCGHETPGWELDERRPRIRFRGDPRRQFVSAPHAVSRIDRRIA